MGQLGDWRSTNGAMVEFNVIFYQKISTVILVSTLGPILCDVLSGKIREVARSLCL